MPEPPPQKLTIEFAREGPMAPGHEEAEGAPAAAAITVGGAGEGPG